MNFFNKLYTKRCRFFRFLRINIYKGTSMDEVDTKKSEVNMTAGEVSKYVVEYAYNKNSSVSNLQLQKILYFLWIDFYKEYREYLFTDPFEAWALGPVIRNVYYDFCSFGSMTILPFIAGFENVRLSCPKERLAFVDKRIEEYIKMSASELVGLSHKPGHAWDVIYKKGEGSSLEIPYDVIIRLECNK